MKWLTYVIVIYFSATSCSQEELPWWKTVTLYEVYPRSFKDSDGDGIGDLKGLIQNVQYFKDIGVGAVWLSPIQTSPMVDFGYDISNYTNIDQIFGTMDDFKELMKKLHKLDIKLIVDFVVNHSSNKHPWFVKSMAKEDPYTDFYVWEDGKIDPATGKHLPPNNWLSEFGGSVWEWYEPRQQFYLHDFSKAQPNFNFRCPAFIERMEEVITFWLDLGVDGFRLDSSKYLFKKNYHEDEPPVHGTGGYIWEDQVHTCTQNQPETFALLERWAQIFYDYSTRPGGKPRALFLEIYDDMDIISRYYGKEKSSLMQPFNFDLLTKGHLAIRATGIKKIVDDWMKLLPSGAASVWVVGNHDKMRASDRYGPEMVDAINLLIGVLPGVMVTYYGEEIGMQDTFIRVDQSVDPKGYLTTRDPARTPMQWDSTISAGFSKNRKPWLPVNPNYWWLNVKAQSTAAVSHLHVYRALMKVRKEPVLQRGELKIIAPDEDILLVIRTYGEFIYMLLINFGSEINECSSTSLFTTIGMDVNWQVAIVSANYDEHKVGDVLRAKALKLTMRPKSAVLLKHPSSSARTSNRRKSSWSTLAHSRRVRTKQQRHQNPE